MDFFKIDDYFEFSFTTRNCITGVGTDADALPTYRVYEENNETAVATGDTAKRDDGNTTGCYIARAQCTTAAGFEVGKKYNVFVTATVNSVADTAPVGEFRIIPVNVWNSLYGGTDSLEVDVTAISGDTTAADNAELMFDGTGYAGGTTKLQTAVTSIATDAITAASIKADAVAKIQAGLSTHSANDVKTAIEAVGSYIYSIKDSIDAIKGLGYTNENLVYIQNAIDDILTDTGTTLDGLIKDLPTVSEFEARTRPSADYALDSTVAKDSTVMKAANYTVPDNVNIVVASQRAVSADNKATSIESKLDLVKAKTDTIPANPAQVGSAMTLTSAYDNAKLAWSTLTAQQVWEYGTRTLSSFGTLVADTADAVWNSLTSALTTVGSIGKLLSQFVFTEAGKVDASATATVDESAIAAAVIAGLGGATVTITSPVSQSNDVTILRDTDYTTEIAWTYTYSGSLTGYTAALHCAGAGITSHTVTIAGSAGAYTLTAAFTNAATAALDTCIDDYSITFTKTADSTVLPYGVEGVMIVRDWGGI